jgi:hypothetical protein
MRLSQRKPRERRIELHGTAPFSKKAAGKTYRIAWDCAFLKESRGKTHACKGFCLFSLSNFKLEKHALHEIFSWGKNGAEKFVECRIYKICRQEFC